MTLYRTPCGQSMRRNLTILIICLAIALPIAWSFASAIGEHANAKDAQSGESAKLQGPEQDKAEPAVETKEEPSFQPRQGNLQPTQVSFVDADGTVVPASSLTVLRRDFSEVRGIYDPGLYLVRDSRDGRSTCVEFEYPVEGGVVVLPPVSKGTGTIRIQVQEPEFADSLFGTVRLTQPGPHWIEHIWNVERPGECVFGDLPPGDYLIAFRSYLGEDSRRVHLEDGERKEVYFALSGDVNVIVQHRGVPQPDVAVWLEDDVYTKVATNADGVAFFGPRAAYYRAVYVDAPVHFFRQPHLKTVQVGQTNTMTLDLEPSDMASLEVEVRNPDGATLEETWIGLKVAWGLTSESTMSKIDLDTQGPDDNPLRIVAIPLGLYELHIGNWHFDAAQSTVGLLDMRRPGLHRFTLKVEIPAKNDVRQGVQGSVETLMDPRPHLVGTLSVRCLRIPDAVEIQRVPTKNEVFELDG
ncbi:MAG: hypothetical protein KDB68_02230 [Planctomycetes bacterium]|nr:hypothetical protein [Planctomycetota bacterium]